LNQTAHSECLALFYAENISGGANTITVSDSILQTLRFSILEYSGMATSSSLDASASAQGSGTNPSSGATTTTANGDLLLGVVMTGDADSFAAGSGYTLEESVPAEPAAKLITEGQIQQSAGSATASVSLTGAQPWAAGIAAFKPAGSVSVDATPGSAQFGNVPVGTNNTQAIQITNGGSASVTISNVSSAGSQFALSGLTAPLTLAAGASAMFTVGFAPTSTGTFSGSVALQMNGSSSSLLIPLLGTGIAVTQTLTVNPANVSFGNVPIGQIATMNVTVQNTGNSTVLVGSVGVGGTGFSVAGLSGGTTIGAGQSATLQAEFVPKSTGTASGTIIILSNAANDPSVSLPIAGTGISSQAHAVDLSWGPSASSGVVGYNVYRSSVSGSGYEKLLGSPVGATTFTDNAVTSGSSYYYVVTSLSATGAESGYSAQTSVLVP
ncbi:MAG: choice-of-anchor D domain-containing protein, partial [Candidatus Acidiferrum sp.]